MYYKDAQAIILTFALNNPESFDNLQQWMKEIDQHCQTNNYFLVIAGTMLDMDDQKGIPLKQG